jgi:hypothetical protein
MYCRIFVCSATFFIERYAPPDFLIVYNVGVSLFFLLSADICFGRIHSKCSLFYSLGLLLLHFDVFIGAIPLRLSIWKYVYSV